jgi:hypothetical protein
MLQIPAHARTGQVRACLAIRLSLLNVLAGADSPLTETLFQSKTQSTTGPLGEYPLI